MNRLCCATLALFVATPLLAGGAPRATSTATRPTARAASTVDPRGAITQGDIPLTISIPGSYYLAENIDVPETMPVAITIAAKSVTLDLMGFVITGADTGTGIGGEGIRISNGTIRGFDKGIDVGDRSSVTDVVVRARKTAIRVGYKGSVVRSTGTAGANDAGTGIVAGGESIVSESIGAGSGDRGEGISVGDHSIIVNSIARGSQFAGFGISAGPYSVVRSSTSEGDVEMGEFSVVADVVSIGSAIVVRGHTVVTGSPTGELWVFGDGNVVRGLAVADGIHVIGNGNRLEDNHIMHGGIEVEGESNRLLGNTFGTE